MDLSKLDKLKGSIRSAKIVGRGIGSGKGGHTTGRGQKGQKSREGAKPNLGFEGGQVPLYKRLPQLGGFKNWKKKKVLSVPLTKFNLFEDGAEVTPIMLLQSKRIGKLYKDGVKVLAVGKLEKKITFKGFMFSEKAQEMIKKAGGKIEA